MRPFVFVVFGGALIGLSALAYQQTPVPPKKAAPGSPLEQRTGTTRVTWRTRTLVGNDRLMQWKTGPSASAFSQITFLEAVSRTDALGMDSIEGSSQQKVSPELPKNLDYRLTADEIAAVKAALKAANVQLIVYRVDALTADRKVFEFAKAVGAGMIIGRAETASLPDLDKLATEFNVKVAVAGSSGAVLDGRSKWMGIAADSGVALPPVKDRLMAVRLRNVAGLTPYFNELNRQGVRPLFLMLESASAGDVDAFEKAVQPALGAFVDVASKSIAIHSGDALPADVKAKIDAAMPKVAYAKPKKPRKLLVIDACVANMSHNTIPHFNLALDLMGKHTGAFEAIFSNDLDNLKWPKIKEWDAIFLNDTVGELFPDLDIRQSLLRFVREGGGIGGWHGSGWASRNWPELGKMMGAADGPHRIEPGYIRLDDPKSPVNQAFDGTGMEHTEEFYRFHDSGPTAYYSRDKVHVLLSMDIAKSPAMPRPGRNGSMLYMRPDGDIAVSWIRSYGKGRVYYNSMGHMPETMMSKAIMGQVFAGVQFILGDLDADTTPSAKLRK